MEIGGRVRAQRQALKLTQEELAREVGVTDQHVSRIETGLVKPSVDLVVKLSRALGVTNDFLLTGDDRPAIDLQGAIRSDARLSADAKRALITLIGELAEPG